MKTRLLSVLIILSFNATAQKIIRTAPIDHSKSLLIKASFLSVLDLQLPTIQVGVEKGISPNSAIEVSYGIPTGLYQGINGTYFKYYKLKAGYKLYLQSSIYIEGELFNSNVRFDEFNYTYYSGNPNQLYRSQYVQAKKNVTGFDVKFGQIFRSGKKVFLEYVFGFGVRNVNINLPVKTNPQATNQSTHPFQFFDTEGNRITPYISIGLALGYKIK